MFDTNRMARTNDPITSKQGALDAKPRLAKSYRIMLAICALYPNRTSGEYSLELYRTRILGSIRSAAETPHKRLPEMERQGLVERTGTRICRDSGSMATTWTVTSRGFDILRLLGPAT